MVSFARFLRRSGAGLFTANVDNDPGGILTYSQAGSQVRLFPALDADPDHDRADRGSGDGGAHGRGHRARALDLIREEFGLRITFFTMVVLGMADLGNIAAEFAGIASGMGIFGILQVSTVPAGAAVVWFVIVRGSYKPVERILILFSLIYFTYPVSAFLAHPDWPEALRQTFIPEWNTSPDTS